jgi:hypothetical protein
MTHGKENHRHALAMENDILETKYLLEALHDMLAEDRPAAATVAPARPRARRKLAPSVD